MKQWPYAKFTYLGADYVPFMPNKNSSTYKREYLTVEAVFVPGSAKVVFFDHYANEFKKQRSELDEYLEKLWTDGWKLTSNSWFDGKSYQFRRYLFRRAVA